MSRIPYLTTEDMTEAQRHLAEKLAASRGGRLIGPGAFWLRNPALADQADELRLLMERRTSLPRHLSELAILVANRHFSASYAWCRHALAAARAGLDRSVMDALEAHQKPTFDDAMADAVYSVAKELLETTGLSDATFGRGRDVLGQERLIELVALVGYGCMLSLAINTFEPDPQPGDDRFLSPGGPLSTVYARRSEGLRLAPLQDMALSDRQRRISDALEMGSPVRVKGAYAIWLRTTEIAECMWHYEQTLHRHLALPQPLIALAVLVAARFWTANDLWAVYYALASDVGLGADVISAIAENRMPSFASEDETIVHAFASQLLAQGRVSDETFNRSVTRLGYQMVVELVGVTGFYSLVALTLNAFESAPARAHMLLPRLTSS
jgi:4-carboxymuconolactone decarboxylase